MKISLFFFGKLGAGARYSFEMAKALSNNSNVELQIILAQGVDNRKDWDNLNLKKNVEVIYFYTYNNKFEFILSYLNIFKFIRISRLIKQYNPSVLYIPFGSLLDLGVLLFIKHIQIYYTLHDPIEHIGEKSIFVEMLRKFVLKKADKVILLNNYFRKYVASFYQISEDNIFVIPHASFFSSSVPILHSQFQKKILFVGRIEEYKGIGILLDAFNIVLGERSDVLLTIAGKGDISRYKKQINRVRNNLIINNRWLTNEEIDNLMQDHDFVILPYLDASQSGVIPVAFANKRFVLVTDKGALKEQVPNNTGFVVEADANIIANQILKLYNYSIYDINNLNNSAYKYACENLTWNASAEILLKNMNKYNEKNSLYNN